MSGWLRNLQGQLTELASEVLSEATEEVEDPGSELQVTKKKLEEAERQLLAERSNSEMLQNKLVDLKEQLNLKNLEVDTMIKKYTGMVESRDSEIRSLQVELERLQHGDISNEPGERDEEDFITDTSVLITRLRLKNEELNKEVQHWKRIASDSGDHDYPQKILELESKLRELKQKSEAEMAALLQAHRENTEQLKSDYEEKIRSLQLAHQEDSKLNLNEEQISTDLNEGWGDETTKVVDVPDVPVEIFKVRENALEQEINEREKRIQNMAAEIGKIRTICDQKAAELVEKDSEINSLRSDLEKAHELIDIQREKFDEEVSVEREKNSQLIAEAQSAESELKSVEEQSITKDHELEKLKRENRELTAAYNDLNEEFENHRAEHGSVVTSNRDLTMRIDALKANLIEYEEKYELCKAENAETAKQLEKLTNDFETLRIAFESTKDTSTFDSVAELERLRSELENVKHDRERLRSDVDRFTQSVKSIDVELNKLRTANKKLEHDNMAMASNLDMFIDIRNTLEKRDEELKKLYAEIVELQEENSQNGILRKALEEATQENEKLAEELAKCHTVISEQESAICKYSAIVGVMPSELVETKDADGKSSSEETSDSYNEWIKTGDWDASTSTGAHHHLMEQLKEALAMVTEKTDECDELRRQKEELEKTLDLRQSCIDELMTQTNSLQAQQELQAISFNELREGLRESDRKKLDAERVSVRMKEEFRKMILFLDVQLQKLNELLLRGKDASSVAGASAFESLLSEVESVYGILVNENSKQQQYINDAALLWTTQADRSLENEFEKFIYDYQKILASLKSENEEKYKRHAEEVSLLKAQIADAEKEKSEVNLQSQNLMHEIEVLRKDNESLAARLTEANTEYEQKKEESDVSVQNFGQEAEEYKRQCSKQAEENTKLIEQLKQKERELVEYERIRSELVSLVEQNREETKKYYDQLQLVSAENELIQKDRQAVMQRLATVEENLLAANEARDKATKEFERLRQHLLSMEESFTNDAIAAEERETALRNRIRELELKTEESADSVISSSNAYQKRLEELSDELASLTMERDQTKEELVEKIRCVENTEQALSNLRQVLRDIGVDHETQIASCESQISALNGHVQKLEKEISNLYSSEEALLAEREELRAYEKELKEELARKDSVIDELETQLDEKVQSTSVTTGSTYRIDDETLRQLFLSYFTAASDKKPEIAVLLASILNYSPEDAAKIQAANASAPRSWFGFGSVQRPVQQTGPSITEQFIRFLERESLGQSSHPLPIETSEGISTIRSARISTTGEGRLPHYSGTGDLRSILDS